MVDVVYEGRIGNQSTCENFYEIIKTKIMNLSS